MADINQKQENQAAPQAQPAAEVKVSAPATGVSSGVQNVVTGAAANVGSAVTGAAGNLTGAVTGAAGNVQGAVTGAAKELTGQIKDVSKMFQVAANQPKVATDERLFGGLSYIPMAPIATLIIKGESPYVQLHGRQSLVLTGLFFCCIFFYLIPLIGTMFAGLVQFGILVIGVFSMYQAFIGNWWKIPVLGDIAGAIPIGMFISITKEAITGQAQPIVSDQDQTNVAQKAETNETAAKTENTQPNQPSSTTGTSS
jgi:uncharacterized membrane protein